MCKMRQETTRGAQNVGNVFEQNLLWQLTVFLRTCRWHLPELHTVCSFGPGA